jgi:hypothetical protein
MIWPGTPPWAAGPHVAPLALFRRYAPCWGGVSDDTVHKGDQWLTILYCEQPTHGPGDELLRVERRVNGRNL